MIDANRLKQRFQENFGRHARMFAAPGRVNLIGEHTDYNDGFVLPMAINYSTVVAASPRPGSLVSVHSLNFHETLSFDIVKASPPQRGVWLDYIEGVARALLQRGINLSGADLLIESDVPVGAGLSSSAALEVSVGLALSTISNQEIDRVALALAGQQAEHEYVGANVGIMDQYVSALAREGHALLIDCRSLTSEAVPMDSEVVVAITNSRVKHELASSEYNTRRRECEEGVEILKEVLPGIKALRDVSSAAFEKYEERLPEVVRRRCRHVVLEDERTLKAAEALKSGEVEEMGRLMYESHASLRDDYQVSCRELDELVEIAREIEGVLGARMTGGGFGGCTVNLLRKGVEESFSEEIRREYEKRCGLKAEVYFSQASDGAHEIV